MRFDSTTTTTDNPVSTDRHNITQSHTPAIGEHLELLEENDNWEHSGSAMPLTAAAPNTRYPYRD